MDKIAIEKNSVQETLIIPLYGRKMCTEKFPQLYSDPYAVEICNRLDYDFSQQDKKADSLLFEFGALESAMRQLAMVWEMKEYIEMHPRASIVNLGCGLDNSPRSVDNGSCKLFNIDFPEIIRIREKLIPLGDRECNISSDLKEESWMEKIDGQDGVIFIAAGVFHYFQAEDVKIIIQKMSQRFPQGRLIFDTVGKTGIKMIKKPLKSMGIKDVKGLFYVDDMEEIRNWSQKIKISYRPYMTGYYNLKNYNIPRFHRILSKLCDKWLAMRIIRMEFIE